MLIGEVRVEQGKLEESSRQSLSCTPIIFLSASQFNLHSYSIRQTDSIQCQITKKQKWNQVQTAIQTHLLQGIVKSLQLWFLLHPQPHLQEDFKLQISQFKIWIFPFQLQEPPHSGWLIERDQNSTDRFLILQTVLQSQWEAVVIMVMVN